MLSLKPLLFYLKRGKFVEKLDFDSPFCYYNDRLFFHQSDLFGTLHTMNNDLIHSLCDFLHMILRNSVDYKMELL